MSKEKSLVEEALIQMKNLEEAVSENAKGILASTMKKEIKDLVKESLSEQDDEIEQTDMEFDDEESEDDIDDTELDVEDDIEDDETDDEELDDDSEETVIDLRNETNPENVLRVFKLMGPEDQIVVTKDVSGHINVKDNETNKEYMIVSESEDEFYDDELESQEMYEFDDDESEEDYDDEELKGIIDDVFSEGDDELVYEIDFEDYEDDEEEDEESYELGEEYDEEELDEEDEEEEDYDDEEESYDLDDVMESFKAKGTGMGKPKFKYDSKPNQGQGFKTKMKQGPKSVGTGKAKFEYKEGENTKGTNKVVKPISKVVRPTKNVKKAETKEGVRTLGAGSRAGRKGGLPKPRAGSAFNSALKENTNHGELQILREKNEEYRNALNVFRNKLNEVAIFNSNLAYATRLFTEHTTSKNEKINILKRFDNVETIKESKNLYQSIKEELNTKVSKPINESIERTMTITPSNGSSVNLIESKTYENPQFMRMKDLMSKIK